MDLQFFNVISGIESLIYDAFLRNPIQKASLKLPGTARLEFLRKAEVNTASVGFFFLLPYYPPSLPTPDSTKPVGLVSALVTHARRLCDPVD